MVTMDLWMERLCLVTRGALLALLCVWCSLRDPDANGSHVLRRRLVPRNEAVYLRGLETSNSTFEFYNVSLVIALSYLNSSTATQLESKNLSNELVSHFCMAVNAQASGLQVQEAADQMGVVVETFVNNNTNNGVVDYQCAFLKTKRSYENLSYEIFGEGFFTLELKVKQAVRVTAPSGTSLSQKDVHNLVENGFNSQESGGLTFRSLLRRNSQFNTVLVVTVRDDLATAQPDPSSSPTSVPTSEPTQATTTAAPTLEPTQAKSDSPSSSAPAAGTTNEPTGMPTPTVVPTFIPTQQTVSPTTQPVTLPPNSAAPSWSPSVRPTEAPTALPSQQQTLSSPTAEPTSERGTDPEQLVAGPADDARLPLIFGAIAGGAASILASCFFIFCVWFPICRPKPRNALDDENDNGAEGEEDGVSSKLLCQTSLSSSTRRQHPEPPIVPDEVQLDGECESLADTTLGDVTTGGEILNIVLQDQQPVQKPRQQKQQQQQLQKTQKTDIESTVFAGSFDDNSLYTNGVEAHVVESSIAPSTQSSNASNNVGNKIRSTSAHVPPTSSGSTSERHKAKDITPPASDGVAGANRQSPSKPGFNFRGTKKKEKGSSNSASSSSSFVGTASHKSDTKKGTSSSPSTPSSLVAGTGTVNRGKKKSSSSTASGPASVAGTGASKSDKKSVNSTTSPTVFAGISPVLSNQERAINVAKTMDAGTKGFDPFNDDSSGSSSFGFVDNLEHDSLKRQTYSPEDLSDEKASPVRSSPSLSSSQKTEKIGNRNLGSPPGNRRRLLEPTEDEEKREVDDDIFDDPASLDVFPGSGLPPRTRKARNDSMKQPDNDSLLRTVLEDARRMSHGKGSKFSLRSAPDRLAEGQAEVRKKSSQLHDLLADNQDLEGFLSVSTHYSRPRTSAKTVGASVYPSSPSSMRTSPLKSLEKQADVKTRITRRDPPPFRTRYLDRGAVVSPPHFSLPPSTAQEAIESKTGATSLSKVSVTPNSSVKKQQPSTPMSSPAVEDGTGALGAERRDSHLDHLISRINMPDTPASSPGILGIATKPKVKTVRDDGSSESEGLSNPWLFDAIEQTLGPRSPAADMESISGRSSRSGRSFKSSRSGKSGKSGKSSRSRHSRNAGRSRSSTKAASQKEVTPDGDKHYVSNSHSYRSRNSPSKDATNMSLGEYKDAAEDPLTPRTLEYDLQRLEVHVADVIHQDTDQMTTSTITASTAGASRSTLSSMRLPPRRTKKKRVVVVVPPGKLGVVLADRHDGKGTVVSEVRASSAMAGMLSPGDKLVAIDGEDVRGMFVSQVTALMASKIAQERRLTVLTSTEFEDLPETKDEDFDD